MSEWSERKTNVCLRQGSIFVVDSFEVGLPLLPRVLMKHNIVHHFDLYVENFPRHEKKTRPRNATYLQPYIGTTLRFTGPVPADSRQ